MTNTYLLICMRMSSLLYTSSISHPLPFLSSLPHPSSLSLSSLSLSLPSLQYFYYSAMVAIIGTAVFIRLNWIIKSVINVIALIIFLVIICSYQACLFDNYDKSVYGICRP